MTNGRKPRSEFLEADSVEDGIAKLRTLQAKRGGAQAAPDEPKRRGRPPKTGRPAGELAAPPGDGRPPFGVSQLTVHRPLGLLEVQEGHDLDALLADPRLAPHIAVRLDERFALVLPASLERLQAALLKVGHTPKVLGAKP